MRAGIPSHRQVALDNCLCALDAANSSLAAALQRPGSYWFTRRRGRMSTIDRLEIGGRLLLWVVLSGVLVVAFGIVPLRLANNSADAETHRKDLAEMQGRLEKALHPPGPELLSIETFGQVLRSFNYRTALGDAWFTNVSPRSGVVCLQGGLTNREGRSTVSLPGCAEVKPYSSVHIELTFAGGELAKLCPAGADDCDLKLGDAQPTSALAPAVAPSVLPPPKPAAAP